MGSTVEAGPLQKIIERRNPNASYHKRCMAVLEQTLPGTIMRLLESRLAIVEAAAENETEDVVYAHTSLAILNSRILSILSVPEWNNEVWRSALYARDLASIEEHLSRLPEQNAEYLLLRTSVSEFLWQNVFGDAIQGTTEENLNYYLNVFLARTERSLKAMFLHLTDAEGELPDGVGDVLLPVVEDALEQIIRDATTLIRS